MGYYVNVYGKITFNDIEGFKKKFPKPRKKNEGMHPWIYFFTKVWEDNLIKLKSVLNNEVIDFNRDGKFWYDDEEAIKYLSKYAKGVLYFIGEDKREWKWTFGNKKYIKEDRPEWE